MRSLSHRARFMALGATVALGAALVAACSSSNGSSSANKSPIVIGTSLSLTGDFSADGQAFKRGYELWASDVNAKGGLLGRKVKL
ncbi:MAG TPA: ABC transporter substrate-binding protein, partial [Streptosporangiaceae bacterium]|nr:ABC transporter substrate-binding protein [Streptosporangiaceae bacterium]